MVQLGVPAAGVVESSAFPALSTTTQNPLGHEIAPGVPGSARLAPCQVGVVEPGLVRVTTLPWESIASHDDPEAHETDTRDSGPPMLIVLHAGVAAEGSVVTTALPALSTATHNEDVGQDTAVRLGPPPVASISAAVQVGLEAVGSVETSASPGAVFRPVVAVATHNDADWHEIAPRAILGAMSVPVQAGVAAVGSVDANTWPTSSIAAQNDVDTQEIPVKPEVLSIFVLVQVGLASVGSVVTQTFPPSSTAAQNDVEAHETPLTVAAAVSTDWFQVGEPAVGFVEIETLNAPTAAQIGAAVHESPDSPLVAALFCAQGELADADGVGRTTVRPTVSATRQADPEMHDAPVRGSSPSGWEAVHVGVADVGSVETSRSPPSSPATHSELETHDTTEREELLLSIPEVVQVGLGSVGFVETSA